MSFTDALALLPQNARQTNAKGFLPPFLRTLGHLLFVLAVTAQDEDTGNLIENEELLAELQHAKDHWDALDSNNALSDATAAHVANFGLAITEAINEILDWDRNTRIQNLRDLANRAVSLSVVLDRELLGLRDSDAGYQL